jgi:hypothetical protein
MIVTSIPAAIWLLDTGLIGLFGVRLEALRKITPSTPKQPEGGIRNGSAFYYFHMLLITDCYIA